MIIRRALCATAVVLSLLGVPLASGAAAGPQKVPLKPSAPPPFTLAIDKSEYRAEETVKISGTAAPGAPGFIEVASAKTVAVRRLDSKPDKDTKVIPWIFYESEDIPAFYATLTPKDTKGKIDALKAQKDDWSYSGALKDLGIDPAALKPADAKVERRKAA